MQNCASHLSSAIQSLHHRFAKNEVDRFFFSCMGLCIKFYSKICITLQVENVLISSRWIPISSVTQAWLCRSCEDWGLLSWHPVESWIHMTTLEILLCKFQRIFHLEMGISIILHNYRASVLTNKINSIHFTSDKPRLHCFSSGLLNVMKRDTSNLELSLEKSCRLSCACLSRKKACHVLWKLEGMLEVNCLLSNLKLESPPQSPQEWARRGGIDLVWGRAVIQDLRMRRDRAVMWLCKPSLGNTWTRKFDQITSKVPSKFCRRLLLQVWVHFRFCRGVRGWGKEDAYLAGGFKHNKVTLKKEPWHWRP